MALQQDHPVLVLESWRYVAPHVLVAAEAMRENHRLPPNANALDPTLLRSMISVPFRSVIFYLREAKAAGPSLQIISAGTLQKISDA
jgi:hypothetical protein